MSTGLTPDFRPNAYKAALSRAATQAESTADTFTDDGGHPLHRQLVQLEDAWTSSGGMRTLFTFDADAVSRRIANALTNHAEAVVDATLAADRANDRSEYQMVMALATSGIAPADLVAPLLQPDGTPLSCDDYADLPSSAVENLLDDGAFGTLASTNGFSGAYESEFFYYYPKS